MKLSKVIFVFLFIIINVMGDNLLAKDKTQVKPIAQVTEAGILFINGKFKKGDNSAVDLLDESIKKVIISSKGGDVEVALSLANKMLDLNVEEVEVDGVCYSSCANYIFMAAKNKRVTEESFLGFHGSALTMRGWFAKSPAFKKIKLAEHAFFKRVKLGLDLYRKSEKVTKKKYDLWLPSQLALESYGVAGISDFWYPESQTKMSTLMDELREKEGKKKLKVLGEFN